MLDCLKPYSKEPRPDWSKYEMWGPGKYLISGDSNATSLGYFAKEILHPECFTAAIPGNIPSHEYDNPASETDKIDLARKRHADNQILKVYLQTGGNLWTWYPLNIFDMNLGVFQEQMRKMIKDWKTFIAPNDIVIASLPYVNPGLKVGDMSNDDVYPKVIKDQMRKIRIVDVFMVANGPLQQMCVDEGVRFLDIYTPMYALWKIHGKSWWWDEVHCDKRVQTVLAGMIKSAWGI